MLSFTTALVGPLSIVLSHYHRKYIWHLDEPARNPYLYVHDLPQETVAAPAAEPSMSAVPEFTTVVMPTPSLFEMPKPIFFMWLLGMLIGIILASAYFAACQTCYVPDGYRLEEIDHSKKSNANILARFKALLASKTGYQRLAETLQAQMDEIIAYSLDRIQVHADRAFYLSQLVETLPGMFMDLAKEALQEAVDLYESLRQQDKAEIQRLKDEVKRLKDENDRKDRDHTDDNNRKDRQHAERIGQMEQQLRDSERGRNDAEQSRDKSEQSRKDTEQKQSDAAKEHQAELDRLNRSHNDKMEKATSENNTKLDSVKTECDASIAAMTAPHTKEIIAMTQKLDAANKSASEAEETHAKVIAAMTRKLDAANKKTSDAKEAHAQEIASMTAKLDAANKNTSEAIEAHAQEIENMAQTLETANGYANDLLKTIETMTANHDSEVTRIRSEREEVEGISASQGAAVDDAVKALRAEHARAMESQKAGQEAAIEKLRQDHDAEMGAQGSALKASHSDEITSLHQHYYKKVVGTVEKLDDCEQAGKRQSQRIVDLESASADQIAALQQEVAELRAALEPARAAPEPAQADPEDENPPASGGQGARGADENPPTGGGQDTSGAPDRKKRPRKHRGVDTKAKGPEGLDADDRRQYISQEVGRRSQNGLIRFTGVDWAAVTDGLDGWNGAMIECLIDEAKMVAKAEAEADGNPQRGNTITQADFKTATFNIDVAGYVGATRSAEETAAVSARPLPWDTRRHLFETYLAAHEFGKRSQDIDWEHINDMTKGFNGAELHRVIKLIIRKKSVEADNPTSSTQTHETMITQADLESTIVQHKAGLAKYEIKDSAQENDTGDRSGDVPDGNSPSEPDNYTPARRANPQPPPGDPSIKPGHGVYTPPHRLRRPN